MNENDTKNIEIQLNDDTAQGIFSNLSIINHSDAEFIFDFVYLQPNVPKGKVRSRIIMTPEHAKRFLSAINDNVNKFESKYGDITVKSQIPAQNLSIQ